MKRKLLAMTLVLALCLSLAATALASDDWEVLTLKAGDTEVKDSKGNVYRFSNPVIGEISNFVENYGPNEDYQITATYYQVPIGTTVTIQKPDGTPGQFNTAVYIMFTDGVFDSAYTISGTSSCELQVEESRTLLHLCGVEADAPATTQPTASKFTDVKGTDWFAKPVAWAVEKNITTGTTATTFSPYQDCTVAQILTFLWRAAGQPMAEGVENDTLQVGDVTITVGPGGPYYASAVA